MLGQTISKLKAELHDITRTNEIEVANIEQTAKENVENARAAHTVRSEQLKEQTDKLEESIKVRLREGWSEATAKAKYRQIQTKTYLRSSLLSSYRHLPMLFCWSLRSSPLVAPRTSATTTPRLRRSSGRRRTNSRRT